MNNIKKVMDIPFQIKNVFLFFGIVLLFYVIYLGQGIILPLVFSILIAILLNPVVNYLTKKKINRIIAIFIVLIITIILMLVIVLFVLSQMSLFSDTLPLLQTKFNAGIKEFVKWGSGTFNLSGVKINAWIDKVTAQGMSNSSVMIGHTLTAILRFLANMTLVPVYIFLILLYKQLLLTFISKVFSNDKHKTVVDVLNETKSLIQNYLIGLLIEAGVVASLNSITLLLIGIDYAVLIGIICAFLNFIPYIGGIVAVVLTMIFALVTKSPLAAVLVLVAHLTVQMIDNTFLVPKIVGSKVKINALVSIVAVLIGGELCGVPGMFLSIPITAIIKVICDRIERFKPLGFLLGDTMPPIGKNVFSIKKNSSPLIKEEVVNK